MYYYHNGKLYYPCVLMHSFSDTTESGQVVQRVLLSQKKERVTFSTMISTAWNGEAWISVMVETLSSQTTGSGKDMQMALLSVRVERE